jgi:hypothetical protein
MARRYARWRIHRRSPSWLRPRQEVAHPLLSAINLKRLKTGVKPLGHFLRENSILVNILTYLEFRAH